MVLLEPPRQEAGEFDFVSQKHLETVYNETNSEYSYYFNEFFRRSSELEVEEARLKFVINLTNAIRADVSRKLNALEIKFINVLDLMRETKEQGQRLVLNETFWNTLKSRLVEMKARLDVDLSEETIRGGIETFRTASDMMKEL